ncbi:hypothetical protein ACFQNE_13760 [Gordonia phosphorivorans]|uniref:Uncharacterized protein n=1 Tax=Gordonia phosphorivorans TaxID=1056982 RepID=A0ABV6HC90_9ACTN
MITRANGLLAGAVSVILGTAAHSLAGGYRPEGRQLLLLLAIGLAVAAVRGAQVDRAQQRRARGRLSSEWASIAGVLIGGQLASHLALSVLGSQSGHQHAVNTVTMAGWHVAALPAAVLALAAISAVLGLLSTTVATLRSYSMTPRRLAVVLPTSAPDVPAHQLAPRLSVGMRAPPALG